MGKFEERERERERVRLRRSYQMGRKGKVALLKENQKEKIVGSVDCCYATKLKAWGKKRREK